jgi:CCR4-NOT transcription complex subunit 1
MEVYTKYFGRLVSSNASRIFQKENAKNTDSTAANYQLLDDELRKVLIDPNQAPKIAETIATAEGDIYRDFDLTTFIKHFSLDPVTNTVLAIAFRSCNRADLRTKAETYLEELFTNFLESLARVQKSNETLTAAVIAVVIESLAASLPRSAGRDGLHNLHWAVATRFETLRMDIPKEITSSVQLLSLKGPHRTFWQRLQKIGPTATASQDDAEALLASIGLDALNETEVANALLFMALSLNSSQYKPQIFVAAIRGKARVKRLDWRNVIQGFDIPDLEITKPAFLQLLNTLVPVAEEDPEVLLQALWGGKWRNPLTQASFMLAFLECSDSEIKASQIPGLKANFSLDDVRDASEQTKKQVQVELQCHVADAAFMSAVYDVILGSEMITDLCSQTIIHELYNNYFNIVLLSGPAIAAPPRTKQGDFIFRFFSVALLNLAGQTEDRHLVLEALWSMNPEWVFDKCSDIFVQDPLMTERILECAEEMKWTKFFLSYWQNPLVLDMVCVLHRDNLLEIDEYVQTIVRPNPKPDKAEFGTTLNKFLKIKAEDEYRTQREEQKAPRSTSLKVKTVFALLTVLADFIDERDLLTPTQRACLATYPRLMNYGQGFDDIIDAAGVESNKLPVEIDIQMSDLFGKMYREEISMKTVLESMRRFKNSRDSQEQDLFACIIHGLFDEYHCFHEYPLDALRKTAVMFGGIINFRLIDKIPQEVGLDLLLEAVREYQPEDAMWKFGNEAITQIMERLPEWAGFCSYLVQVPSLANTEIRQRAEQVLHELGHDVQPVQANGLRGGDTTSNAGLEAYLTEEELVRAFQSVHAESPEPGRFEEPDEPVQEKILFVINNLSNDNLDSKLGDLTTVLQESHYQWFANYLVEQRARLEPNNHGMYLRLIDSIGQKLLMSEVLRETYVSIARMINAESTMTSTSERAHLRALGTWLGSLTLARNKPVKHKNIYFVELLLEGHDTGRLLVVIPFTCKVLMCGKESLVFRPPNPWVMEILKLLRELHLFADLTTNMKFELEILCKEAFDMDYKELEPSTILRDRPSMEDDLTNLSAIPDLDRFDELSLNGIARGTRERLSTEEIMASLPSLEDVLKCPPLSGTPAEQGLIRSIIYRAFDQAIQEIIAPVVERSITIASISTAQLIAKDFATEVDVEKYRQAAHRMVKSLAGSLALVTCKEPLRMSITNYIRRPSTANLPDQFGMAEGAILMVVNDNLDTACSFVEEAAAARSLPEIDIVIEGDLEERRRHLAERPDAPFVSRNLSQWGMFLPEPYKKREGGLNAEQNAVYENFDRNTGATHIQNASMDSTGRQLPDVLQEAISLPSLATPAEQPALPHTISSQQDDHHMRMMPMQPRINGFGDNVPPQERIQHLLGDIHKGAVSSSVGRVRDLEPGSQIVLAFNQILQVVRTSYRPNGETLARQFASKILESFFDKPDSQLYIEILAHLLCKLCQLSEITMRDVQKWLASQDETTFLAVRPVTVALVSTGLVDSFRIDSIIARALQPKPEERNEAALQLLLDLLDYVLFCDEPTALRADFACSLEAMKQWLAEEPNQALANEINSKLEASTRPNQLTVTSGEEGSLRQDQTKYMFAEWVRLYENPGAHPSTQKQPTLFLRWIWELHQEQVLNTDADVMAFFRVCIDESVMAFNVQASRPNANFNDAFLHIDAFAKLVIMLVRYNSEHNGAVKSDKTKKLTAYLQFFVMVLNEHHKTHGDNFNQRVFYRLFQNLLSEYETSDLSRTASHPSMMLAFADVILNLQPAHFPRFAFAWMALLAHRSFVSGLLNMADEAGWSMYKELVRIMLVFATDQFKQERINLVSTELHRGVLAVLLMVHHDFPDFICENHQFFCDAIPDLCPQVRNVILSAMPRGSGSWPDPTTIGLKVERIEGSKKAPVLAVDLPAETSRLGLKSAVDAALGNSATEKALNEACERICECVSRPREERTDYLYQPVFMDFEALSTVVLYIATEALGSLGRFDASSHHIILFEKMAKTLGPEGRYYLFGSFFDQLRYPNTHSIFFCYLILHLFGADSGDEASNAYTREQIATILMKRLGCTGPHPYFPFVLFFELQGNPKYHFWDLPFLNATPEAKVTMSQILKNCGGRGDF